MKAECSVIRDLLPLYADDVCSQASRRLVDTLVREDPATGQASINIPVSGKESVLQFVSLLGKLLK